MTVNEHGQPVGPPLGVWSAPPFPPGAALVGRTVRLEVLDPQSHGPGLWEALRDAPASTWTYMSFGPFHDYDEFEGALQGILAPADWIPYAAIVDDTPLGFASYLRIEPHAGSIEIGSITWSPPMQKTTASTEALFLMLDHVFDLGYRRCEWKCDDLNGPSRATALRLGFTYEGTFRKATHYKGRNRDTAWYSMVDDEWPDVRRSFHDWLSEANFDEKGRQMRSLREMMAR
ncbi:MAG TPA: GNAT family protein [Acidimicrobiia bacterium]|nr:GNAT family protein [Acidimicrobiia bacterium]